METSNAYQSIYDGPAIDAAIARASEGGHIDAAIQAKPNPNLLDNWYFGNPVDQSQGRVVKPNTTYYSDNQLTTSAGTTSAYVTAYRYATGTANGVNYASFKLTDSDTAPTYYAAPENVVRGYTGAGYTIDRLKMVAPGVLLITDNGINLKLGASTYGYSAFSMLIDGAKKLLGKTVTLSILTTNGLSSNSGVLGSAPSWITTYSASSYVRSYFDGDLLIVQFILVSDNDPDIIAAKLELGTHQTLAHQENGNWVLNEIPDYGEQLLRCQRYFQLYSAADKRPAKAVDCRPVMRADPSQGTIAIGGTTYYYNTAEL